MMRHGFITWADYHRTAMRVLGKDVELVGIPLANLIAAKVPNVGICVDIFAYNLVYSSAKLMRDGSAEELPYTTTVPLGSIRFTASDKDAPPPDSRISA